MPPHVGNFFQIWSFTDQFKKEDIYVQSEI